MPYADKQKQGKYTSSYSLEHYARLALTMTQEDADLIRSAATEAGQSYSQYVLQAVRERIARDTAQD